MATTWRMGWWHERGLGVDIFLIDEFGSVGICVYVIMTNGVTIPLLNYNVIGTSNYPVVLLLFIKLDENYKYHRATTTPT